MQDLWRQWWVGDTVRQVPPLRLITTKDVGHLDKIPIQEEERHARTVTHKESRRPARKILSDIEFLMVYITDLVKANGTFEATITLSSVDRMYDSVSAQLLFNNRDVLKLWYSSVKEIHKRVKG